MNLKNVDKSVVWLWVMFIVQWIVLYFQPGSLVVMTASFMALYCVWNIAKGKARNFILGIISSLVFVWLALQNNAPADAIVQTGYIVMDFVGIYLWKNSKNGNKPRKLDVKEITIASLVALMLIVSFKLTISHYWIDAVVGGSGILAMYFTARRWKHTFVVWLAMNVLQAMLWIVLYIKTGTAPLGMAAMYIIFIANSVYGLVNWEKEGK